MPLEISRSLLPADGRFGSGPSKVRPEALAELADTGTSYLGTSHRRDGVKDVVRRVRSGLAELLGAPDGYEVVLGVGGATVFWDMACFGLIEHRSQHLSLGEFSAKFAAAAKAAPFLADPVVEVAPPGSAPTWFAAEDADAHCWPHNETSTGVALPVVRPGTEGLVLVDATSGGGALPVALRECDAYYLSPQKVLAAEGGLWLAVLSPAALERIARLCASRWVPPSLDLQIAVDNSRADQTYNTPALATLLLTALQLEWLLSRGGLPWSVARCAESARRLYAWAESSSYCSPFVTEPALRSPVVGTVRFADEVPAARVCEVLRANGILDVEAYRGAGYNGIRVGMFPAVDPDDVSALTSCVDWVVSHLP